MFTGLIEQVGTIGGWQRSAEWRRLTIQHAAWNGADDGLATGDSVAVDGVCLTAEIVAPDHFVCAVLDETVTRSSLDQKEAGARVNLERAMLASSRFGGHMVQGHVDAVGHVRAIRRSGVDWIVRVACDAELMSGVVEKGSVALDGISLTVVGVGADWFEVHLIPHTWTHTAWVDLVEGRAINIETDIIGKYVQRHLETGAGGAVTMDKLRAAGSWGL